MKQYDRDCTLNSWRNGYQHGAFAVSRFMTDNPDATEDDVFKFVLDIIDEQKIQDEAEHWFAEVHGVAEPNL